MSKLTGAEIVIQCLREQGVDTVFGYPGGGYGVRIPGRRDFEYIRCPL